MESVQSGLQTYAKIKTIMSLIFFIILLIIAIFIFIYLYKKKVLINKKTEIIDDRETTTSTLLPCPDDNNSECLSMIGSVIPTYVPIIGFLVLIIIIIVVSINLHLINTDKSFAAVQGGITAASDLSNAFRPSTNVIRFGRPGFRRGR